MYETVADVYPKSCDNVSPNTIPPDNISPAVRKIPSDVCEISGDTRQAENDTGYTTPIPAYDTGYVTPIPEDDPGYLLPTIQQQVQHETPAPDGTYEVPALPEEISVYTELDSERFEEDNTYQKLLKQESHDHDSSKMSKAKKNLSDYEELDGFKRVVEQEKNVYQKLVKI